MTSEKPKPTAIVAQAGLPAFGEFLRSHASALSKVMENGMRPDRIVRLAIAAVSRAPALQDCTMLSIFEAVAKAAEIGFEAGGTLGEVYLVPFGKTCTLIVGYQGYVSLIYESGLIKDVCAREVYQGDEYSCTLGTNPNIQHTPHGETDAARITHVYAVAHTVAGGVVCEPMTRAEIDSVRARSKAANAGPWVTDYAMMARKTALRRLQKWLPKTAKLRKAEAVDLASDTGDALDAGVFDVIDLPAQQSSPQSRVQQIKESVGPAEPAEAERLALVARAEALLAGVTPALHKALVGDGPLRERSIDELQAALEMLQRHAEGKKPE